MCLSRMLILNGLEKFGCKIRKTRSTEINKAPTPQISPNIVRITITKPTNSALNPKTWLERFSKMR